MKRKYLISLSISILVLAGGIVQIADAQNRTVLNEAQRISGDQFTLVTRTPKGAYVYALKQPTAEMLAAIDHIGVSGSIAEIYAERMRAFQRAGNKARAEAAFKLAVHWMNSYAASATSGGEGAALSYECDQFRHALAREFGYDPTDDGRPSSSHSHLP